MRERHYGRIVESRRLFNDHLALCVELNLQNVWQCRRILHHRLGIAFAGDGIDIRTNVRGARAKKGAVAVETAGVCPCPRRWLLDRGAWISLAMPEEPNSSVFVRIRCIRVSCDRN